MLKNRLNIPIIIGLALALFSCQEVIEIEPSSSPKQIVIEGNITDSITNQVIKISQSVPYTDSNVYPPISGAQVTVSDDIGNSWRFKETQPGEYTFGPLKGVSGRTYTLVAQLDDIVYTASSTMPAKVDFDRITSNAYSLFGEERHTVDVSYNDPADITNYYRFIMKINGLLVKQVFVENDRFTNGKSGARPLFHYTGNDEEKIKKQDTLEIEMQSIDKKMYTYWLTLASQSQIGLGGGITPSNPPSNINNNALGYFSAHTSEIKSIIVK